MQLVTRELLARDIAMFVHGDQKYGDKMYISHLEEVAEIARPWGEDAVVAAYLHNAIEDTTLDSATIRNLFGPLVAEAVLFVTDPPAANRKARKARSYATLGAIEPMVDPPGRLALIVKAADRLANVRACVRDKNEQLLEMYRKEHAAFRAAVFRPHLNDDPIVELDDIFAATELPGTGEETKR